MYYLDMLSAADRIIDEIRNAGQDYQKRQKPKGRPQIAPLLF